MSLKKCMCLLVTSILLSCNKYKELDFNIPQNWDTSYYAFATFYNNDTSSKKDIYFEIVINEKYRYENLWCFSKIYFENKPIYEDTLNFIFTDNDQNKKICFSNNTYTFLYRKNFNFFEQGDYKFYLINAMRFKSIENIKSIKLKIK